MGGQLELRRSYDVAFPRETVYSTWVSSDTVIAPATAMDIEPIVGGHYRLIMKSADFEAKNEGRFLLVEPGRHIRYTWEWNNDGEVSEIDVTFTETEAGTRIEIHHSGFDKPESVEIHATGWDNYIAGLERFIGDA